MPTPLDLYVAPAARHARPTWLDSRTGATVSIAVTGLLAIAAGMGVGLGLAAIPLGLAGVLFWLGFLRMGLWRFLAGLAMIILGWVVWTIIVMIVGVLVFLGRGLPVDAALDAMRGVLESPTPQGVMMQLVTFAGVWVAAWAAVELLHGQRFGTLFSPLGRIRWGEFGNGVVLALGFWIVTMAIGITLAGLPTRTDISLGSWLMVLGPLAVLVFFQASAEEIIFRGYILQQVAARYRHPLFWGFLPAFLFGLAHYGNGTELGIGWHYVAVTTLVGLAAAALVWRTGGLGAAMGFHTGMNIFSLSTVGLDGIIEGTQLYLYDGSMARPLFAADGVATLLLLLFVLSPVFPFRARPAPAQA